MIPVGVDPRLWEAATSAAILLASYVAARALSHLFTRVLSRAARRTATSYPERLVAALQRPLTWALVLVGAWSAMHRLSAPPIFVRRIDHLLFVLAVLVAVVAVVRALRIFVGWYTTEARQAKEGGPAVEFGPLLEKVGIVFVVVVALIVVLQRFGVNVASLVVSLGVGSLALGLAAQDTLSNMFAGFTLMADRTFRVGDRVQLAGGELGDVVEIGMRATLIRTIDETMLVVPNSVLVKEKLTNLSSPNRRLTVRMDVGVAYGSDLAAAAGALREAALSCERVERDPEPLALLTGFGDSSVNFRLVFQVRDYLEHVLARSEVNHEIVRRLAEAGVEIPYPVRRLIHTPAGPSRAGVQEA